MKLKGLLAKCKKIVLFSENFVIDRIFFISETLKNLIPLITDSSFVLIWIFSSNSHETCLYSCQKSFGHNERTSEQIRLVFGEIKNASELFIKKTTGTFHIRNLKITITNQV